MTDGGDEHGPASDLAKQAADRVEGVAGWLDRHEPGDLLDEVRRLARRRPGAFLVGTAIAGALAGRLTRGAVDAKRDTGSHDGPTGVPAGRPRFDSATDTVPIPPIPPVGAVPTTPVHATPPPYPPPAAMPPPPPAPAGGPTGAPLPGPGTTAVPPAHAPRPGSMTVGEYVDELREQDPRDPR